MDLLIKQMRKKQISGQEKEGGKNIPPRKSISFKENKKSSNWFQRQFSREISGSGSDYDRSSDMEGAAAVAAAAAAYAITSLEEENWRQTHSSYELQPFLTRPRSRREDRSPSQELRNSSRRLSGSSFSYKDPERREESPPELKFPARKVNEMSPWERETQTVSAKLEGDSKEKQRNDSIEKPAKPIPPAAEPPRNHPPPPLPPPPPPPPPSRPPREIKNQSYARHIGSDDSVADAWEKEQLDKIKERYETLSRKIESWEMKKKDKARRKLEKTEGEMDQRRNNKGLQTFREDMEYIEQIAGGARAQAKKQRQSEEKKVKEKAAVIRTTGKLPTKSCLCF